MLAIREEIRRIENGEWTHEDNPLVNAPHTLADLTGDWNRGYDRKTAVFPLDGMNPGKYLTPGEPHRQRLRRPSPHLHLPVAHRLGTAEDLTPGNLKTIGRPRRSDKPNALPLG